MESEREGRRKSEKIEIGVEIVTINGELRIRKRKNGRLDAVSFIRDTLSGERLKRGEERVYTIMGWVRV